jgi:hypothetical protein
VNVYRLDDVVPRFALVPSSRVLCTPFGALELFVASVTRGSPMFTLEAPRTVLAPATPAPWSAAGSFVSVERDGRGATVHVRATEPSILRMSEAYMRGWQATVDARSVPVLCADGFLTAVVVPPGEHVVRFAFETPFAGVGAALSLAVGGVLACALALSRGRPASSSPSRADS